MVATPLSWPMIPKLGQDLHVSPSSIDDIWAAQVSNISCNTPTTTDLSSLESCGEGAVFRASHT